MGSDSGCRLCGNRAEIFFVEEAYPAYVRPVDFSWVDRVPWLPFKLGYCCYCHHVSQVDPPPSELMDVIYSELYSTYHSAGDTGIGSDSAHRFLEFLRPRATTPGAALEIGCGDGFFLSLLKAAGWRVYGCDPSPKAAKAEAVCGEGNVQRALFSGDLYRGQHFGLVVMRHLLEHIPSPVPFLEEVRELLEPGGLVAIEVPNVLASLAQGVPGDFCHEHLNYFTPQSLAVALGRSGYTAVTVEERGPFLYACGVRSEKDPRELVEGFGIGLARLREELLPFLTSWQTEKLDVYVYGAGGHTTGLVSRIVRCPVKGIIDSDPAKWGKVLPALRAPIFSPAHLETLDPTRCVIVISSRVFQDEIASRLQPYVQRGMRVLVLYPHCRYL